MPFSITSPFADKTSEIQRGLGTSVCVSLSTALSLRLCLVTFPLLTIHQQLRIKASKGMLQTVFKSLQVVIQAILEQRTVLLTQIETD